MWFVVLKTVVVERDSKLGPKVSGAVAGSLDVTREEGEAGDI